MKFGLDERNLSKQFLFWAAITFPLSLFFLFGIPLWKDLTFGFTVEAYKNFLEINKFPLYLFSTCVPLVAIVAYMHRTIQTEKQIQHTQTQLQNTLTQIKITENKNKSDSYYSHVKFVVDAVNSFPVTSIIHTSFNRTEVEENFTFNQPYALYKIIFPESNLDLGFSKKSNEAFTNEIKSIFNSINSTLLDTENNKEDSNYVAQCLCEIDRYIIELCERLLIDYNPHNHLHLVNSHNSYYVVSFKKEEQLKETLHHLFKTTQRICDFIGMDSNFLRPHPLNDDEHVLLLYINNNETLFRAILPSREGVEKGVPMGFAGSK